MPHYNPRDFDKIDKMLNVFIKKTLKFLVKLHEGN